MGLGVRAGLFTFSRMMPFLKTASVTLFLLMVLVTTYVSDARTTSRKPRKLVSCRFRPG